MAKFADHLPLYRQSVIYAREGIERERELLADWVGWASALHRPLVDAIRLPIHADFRAGARQRQGQDGPAVGLYARR